MTRSTSKRSTARTSARGGGKAKEGTAKSAKAAKPAKSAKAPKSAKSAKAPKSTKAAKAPKSAKSAKAPKSAKAAKSAKARSAPSRTTPAKRRTQRAPERPARSAPAASALEARFDSQRLRGYLDAARRGEAHLILDVPLDLPIREALVAPPPWGEGSYEKLLALYLATDTFGFEELGGVIYDFAEHTYFRYDDEGYALAQVHADLGFLHATSDYGLFDEQRAVHYYRAALAGPYPEGVYEELDAVLAVAKAPLRLLEALRHALATENEASDEAADREPERIPDLPARRR